jgi:transposase InsO family protein
MRLVTLLTCKKSEYPRLSSVIRHGHASRPAQPDVFDVICLLRDRDGSYERKFHEAADWLGIREVLTAPQSPWQNAYVERLIGSIRRECLDHVIVLNETGLRRTLKSYFAYYERTRTHLSLGKDAPVSRPVQATKGGVYPKNLVAFDF